MALPIVNLKHFSSPDALSSQLIEVGRNPGFFYLTGHTISSDIISRTFDLSKTFFQTCNEEEKLKFASKNGEPGYSGVRKERLSGLGRGDVKEAFHFRCMSKFPDDELPEILQRHKSDLQRFNDECEALGKSLLEAFAIGLKQEKSLLADKHSGQQYRFRFLHYPAVPLDASTETDIRAGAHSDYGSLTLLFQEPSDTGGLQVWDARRSEWQNVPYLKDAIVVNIGDALEFWTAGRLRSTIHRVVFPQDGSDQSRYSIPFFITPDDEAILKPILEDGNADALDLGTEGLMDLMKVKGYTSLDPVTALEHRVRREAGFMNKPSTIP